MPSFNNTRALIDEIDECSRKGNTKKKYLEEKTALCLFFQNYYGGKEHPETRLGLLDTKILDILADQDSFYEDVLIGIRSYFQDKYLLTSRLEKLFKHLKKNFGFIFSEDFFVNLKNRDRTERLLKTLKYLHSGDKSREQIAENFGISDRALADDLKTLLEGFDFLESTMQISELERKKNTYRSLIHPVFLAMNTSEIYALTVGLKLLSQGTVFEDSLGSIANKVYKQLSGYAKAMADQHTDDLNISFEEEELKFINTCDLFFNRDCPFTYFLKEPLPCEVTYLENGKELTLTGVLKLARVDGELKFDRIVVQTDCNTHELAIQGILSITKQYQG